MKTRDKLIAAKVAYLKKGFHSDGGNLYLNVKESGGRSWIFRYERAGHQRDLGLGAFPDVSLKQAREKAAKLRRMIADGLTPVLEKPVQEKNFQQVAVEYIEGQKSGWKNEKHYQQWLSTLEQYAFPSMGRLYPKEIALEHVLRILKPIWESKTETASRVRARLERVLDYAKAHGLRSGDNPAAWKGNLDSILPKASSVTEVEHFKAVSIEAMPDLYESLKKSSAVSALCLRWVILTACRSGEGRGSLWSEIDRHRGTWTIPAARAKTKKAHVVPFSGEMLAVLEKARDYDDGSGLIFPSPSGKTLSDVALAKALKTRLEEGATVHGMRSAFKDWALERCPLIPDHVSEACLAHASGDKVRDAYARTDLVEQKKDLLERWSDYLTCGRAAGY
ncbi:tyrosine-type recombinase/integrase [Desulfobotulus sp.]|uniref:tyrosine-type recombinase/integrase n=1 Tax=Desulfobotulus sp. TaxID=1940337 RepID=UPI002A35DB45|nr:integrase arm-type DNA-binding domain-containing protein [Desulfobotulus sp.]MDY0164550.1 integrase arm-type DNA-binding domain-containing protein [Desulfobotulus sp.]